MAAVVIAVQRRLHDGVVHELDLVVGPWVVRLGRPVFEPVASNTKTDRMGLEKSVSRFMGCSANWMPFFAKSVWT